ncbi:MAG: collagen binding domain-containing protein [Thermomicrobiales bacterium]
MKRVATALRACIPLLMLIALSLSVRAPGVANAQETGSIDVAVSVTCNPFDEASGTTLCTITAEESTGVQVDTVVMTTPACATITGGTAVYEDPNEATSVSGYAIAGAAGTLVLAGNVTAGGLASYSVATSGTVHTVEGAGFVCAPAADDVLSLTTTATLAPMATATATATATTTPTETATTEPAETATAVATETDAVTEPGTPTVTATITIVATEVDGSVRNGLCYSLFTDAGDGTPAEFVAQSCDYYDGNDGTTTFTELAPGNYVLQTHVEYAGDGFAPVPDQVLRLEPGEAEAVAITVYRAGALLVHKVNAADEPLSGACFDLYTDGGDGTPSTYLTGTCDWYDGSNDGAISFGYATGNLVVVETQPPAGFLFAPHQSVHVDYGQTAEIWVVDPAGATIAITKVDPARTLLPHACFDLYIDAGGGTLGDYRGSTCDWDNGEDDGRLTFSGLESGNYVLVETQAPVGYLKAPATLVAGVVAGQTTDVTITDPKAGTLVVHKTNQDGAVLSGACFRVHEDAGKGALGPEVTSACDDWDGSNDGTITLLGLSGNYVLVESRAPDGYLTAPNWAFQIRAGQTHERTVVDKAGGRIVIHLVDQNKQPLPGASYFVYADAGGVPGAFFGGTCDGCDSTEDGTATIRGLPTGKYLVSEFQVPTGYLGTPLTPVSVKAGKESTVTLVNSLGAILVVRTSSSDGTPLSGACYGLFVDLGGGSIGEGIANGCAWDSNELTFRGLATGDYVLHQYNTPFGFVAAADTSVHAELGQTTSVDVTNIPLGKVILHTVNQAGETIVGACFEVRQGDAYWSQACDDYDDPDGHTTFSYLAGDYTFTQTGAARGYFPSEPFDAHVEPGDVLTIDVVDELGGIVRVHSVGDDGEDVIGLCAALYRDSGDGSPGDIINRTCDGFDGALDASLAFDTLATGNYVLVPTSVLWTYQLGPDVPVSVEVGQTVEIQSVSHNLGTLVVRLTNDAGEPLSNFCFDLFTDAGEGQRGDYIASSCNGGTPWGNGAAVFGPLGTGSFVLVHSEAPQGYDRVADAVVAVSEGHTTELTLIAFPPKALYVKTVDEAGNPLLDACFALRIDLGGGTPGAEINEQCDSSRTPRDGTTAFFDLETGDYVLIQTQAVDGYALADPITAHFEAGITTAVDVVNRIGGVLTVKTVDEAGEPIVSENFGGPCFELYEDEGSATGDFVAVKCDWHDELDGVMHFTGLRTGDYILVEQVPPYGYLPGPDEPVHVELGQTVEIIVSNQLGGWIEVTTTDGTQPLIELCYDAYADAGGGVRGDRVKSACDGWDGAYDGMTAVRGLETGDYVLVQYNTPDGYVRAPDQPVHVDIGLPTVVTVTNELGGIIEITTTDGQNPLPGACFEAWTDAGDGTPVKLTGLACDEGDGEADGVMRIIGLPTGNYVVIQSIAPEGYAPAANTIVPNVIQGQTTTISVTNAPQEGAAAQSNWALHFQAA